MSKFVVAKCIEVFSPEREIIELIFDRKIDLKCHMVKISVTGYFNFLFKNNNGIYAHTTSDVSYYKDIFLNKYMIIYSTINDIWHNIISPSKEEIWEQLGSLENPELEEIDCYIRVINVYG